MKTRYIVIEPDNVDNNLTMQAGLCIKGGGVVALPTETVYGLGANGFCEEAVKKVFLAKGRPSDNPLILHVSQIEDIKKIAVLTDNARLLFERFTPGPLTVVMKKLDSVPNIISAGLDTVAVRIPAHPVARAVINAAGVPVAAPSANLSGCPSPTKSEHVINDLDGKIDMIVDGGECTVGLESTVVDMTGESAVILRPGAISAADIAGVVGLVVEGGLLKSDSVPKSPGMKYRHYAPNARVIVVEGSEQEVADKTELYIKQFMQSNNKVGVFAAADKGRYPTDYVIYGGYDANKYAKGLFDALRSFDLIGVDVIISQIIWEGGISDAIRNRLYKAASRDI